MSREDVIGQGAKMIAEARACEGPVDTWYVSKVIYDLFEADLRDKPESKDDELQVLASIVHGNWIEGRDHYETAHEIQGAGFTRRLDLEPLESTIWATLEPYLETVIHLDLNHPAQSAQFRGLVRQVAHAVRARE